MVKRLATAIALVTLLGGGALPSRPAEAAPAVASVQPVYWYYYGGRRYWRAPAPYVVPRYTTRYYYGGRYYYHRGWYGGHWRYW